MKRMRLFGWLLSICLLLPLIPIAGVSAEFAVLEQVELTVDLDFAVGDVAEGRFLELPADAPYTLDCVDCTNRSTDERVEGELDYGRYLLSINLMPDDGYTFSEEIVAIINGEEADPEVWQVYSYGHTALLMVDVEIAPPNGFVEDILLYGAPDSITAGDTITVPELEGEGAFTITNVQWNDRMGTPVSDVFKDGHDYYLNVTLEAPKDSLFDISYAEVYSEQGVFLPEVWVNEDGTATLSVRYSLMPVVDEITINMAKPALGTNLPSPVAPEGAPYSVEDYVWIDTDTEDTIAAFLSGHSYYLQFTLVVADGYELAEDAIVTVGGEEVDLYFGDAFTGEAIKYYSFLEKIGWIEFPALPQVAVGDEVAPMELETPEGANYSLAAVWLSYTGDMETVEFSGALEDKSLYFLGLVATPLPGYEFAEDVGFIVDGETAEGAFRMASAEIVMLLKQYSFGLTEIATVELTVAAPAVGKQPGEVTWPEEAPYILEEISWGVSDTDDLFSTEDLEANAVFEAGKHYWLSGTLQAEEGYVFAENVVITVNGQPMDKSILGDFAELPMVLGNMGVVLYDFGMLEEVVRPGDGNENEDKPTNTDKPADKPVDKPADTSPDTGDRTAMPLALTLMLLATAIVWGFKSQSVRA